MVFSSPIFLFLFLPIVLGIYFLLPKRLWNAWLLIASIVFYAWGERLYTVVMLASMAMNYGFGLLVDRTRGTKMVRWSLALAIFANLSLLVVFKYSAFLGGLVSGALQAIGLPGFTVTPLPLPVGISFFTFHALSYVVDVYRSHASVQKDPAKLSLYIVLFPQLVAGPILRFHDVAPQIDSRSVSLEDFAAGVRRFIIGLGKKVLLANPLAEAVDGIFGVPAEGLKPLAAWLAITAYTLQIYFDFSGYSDMALGLGRMLGFTFPENFNYPYISRSVQDFWRRWHISLSTWFRDYLYIPLGGNRLSASIQYRNLLIVFFLCGLWHGASWNFVIWGLFHGFFLIVERTSLAKNVGANLPSVFGHIYTLLVVVIGWVFFRTETLSEATTFLKVMFASAPPSANPIVLAKYFNVETQIAFVCALIACLPWKHIIETKLKGYQLQGAARFAAQSSQFAAQFAILILVLSRLSAATYNPFIYFRF